MKCVAQRLKTSRYLSNTNIQGKTYQKCGRVAVAKDSFGRSLCRQCAEARNIPIP